MTDAPPRKRAPRKTAAKPPADRKLIWRPLAQLVPDPGNVNTHTPAQIDALRGSLRRFGQPRPVLINASDVVLAGNGLLEAARLEAESPPEESRYQPVSGVYGLWCQYFEGNATEATAYAIADNKLGRMSSFDDAALREQIATLPDDLAPYLGWTATEIEKLLAGAPEPNGGGGTGPELGGLEYRIIIECRDEEHQRDLLERLEAEGLDCRPVMS